MIARLVSWSARHHWLVIVGALCFAAAGERARRHLARDVIPDLSEPQIGLVADWMGHPASEVASAVTTILTQALAGIPGERSIRGSTMTGMAYIDVVVDSVSGLDAARRAIVERVAAARPRLPRGVRLQIGPAASSTGWVFEYALTDPGLVSSLLELRRFQEDVLRPALAAIPGVAEVALVGGELQQVRVDVKPRELREQGLAVSDVVSALRGLIGARPAADERAGTARAAADTDLARASLAEVGALVVRPAGGSSEAPGSPRDAGAAPSVRLRDVAVVRVTDDMQSGLADLGGRRAVGGIVIARRDANIAALVDEVKRTIARECLRLPRRAADRERMDSGAAAYVHVATVYDRADLATRVRQTLLRALGEEVAVVVLIILLFLLHGRSALVPLMTLPVVLLLTFGGMWVLGVPATIMSLGGIGIALGMAVDADIVALEGSHRRLETVAADASMADRRAQILAAAQSFAPAILTSLMIAALSFLPVLAFSGETGRLLRPLALTKTLVVAAAAVVTLTLAPALRDRLLRGRVIPEFANPLTRGLVRLYRPFVHFALRRPALTLMTAALALASCLPIAFRLGGEFLPRVDEGDVLYMPTTLPGVLPEAAAQQLAWMDHTLSEFGEVATVFGKVGRADSGTDPAPYSMAEITLRLRPRAEWPKVDRVRWYRAFAPGPLRRGLQWLWPEQTPRTTAELVEEFERAVRLPGWVGAWTAPARARMDMMATGLRTAVGARIVAADPARLDALGAALRTRIGRLPGTRSAVYESLGGETWLSFATEAPALARYGVDAALVQSTANLFVNGGQIGDIEQGGRRLRLRVAPEPLDIQRRGPGDQLREVTVRRGPSPSPGGADGDPGPPVPLGLLGHPIHVRRPAVLRTEGTQMVAYVDADLKEGVDIERYVDAARRDVDTAVARGEVGLLPGERIEWIGQHELLVKGRRRLKWIVPVVALSMLGLLFLQFRSLTEAMLVLISVPFALVGSVWTLFLLGYPLSAPVWVGLLSVVGLAMQTGVVMVVYIDEAFHRRVREGRLQSREDIVAAHAEGTIRRLRPKLMTITTMAASLLPLLWSEGAGAEIMRRVAAPMLGGLMTSAFLTLEVLPVLYTIWRYRQLRRAERTGLALATIVGEAPAWARR